MTNKPLPPGLRNKLLRGDEPLHIDLQGPGPFQLPLLVRVESILAAPHLEIRLETESGQEVRIHLTEIAFEILRQMLNAEKQHREGA